MRAAGLALGDSRLAFAESKEREFVFHDLQHKPDVVLVDHSRKKHGISQLSFDVLDFYLEDQRFRQEWEHYKEIDSIGSNRVFLRKK